MSRPILSLALEEISQLNAEFIKDDLLFLYKSFSKARSSLQNGVRLENLAWRLLSQQIKLECQQQDHQQGVDATEPVTEDENTEWEETDESRPPSPSLARKPTMPPDKQRSTEIKSESSSAPSRPTFLRGPSSIEDLEKKARTGSFNLNTRPQITSAGQVKQIISSILPMQFEPSSFKSFKCSCNNAKIPTTKESSDVDSEPLVSPNPKNASPLSVAGASQSTVSTMATTDHTKSSTLPAHSHKPTMTRAAKSSSHVHKRPALHHRHLSDNSQPYHSSSKAPLPRNASAKSVRILDAPASPPISRTRNTSSKQLASANMSRSGSSDRGQLHRTRSRESHAASTSKRTAPVSVPMPLLKQSSSSANLISVESRSVVKGFEPSSIMVSSATSNLIPPAPNVSPADSSPPRFALASGPASRRLTPIPASEAEDSGSSLAQSIVVPPAPPPTPFGSVLPAKGLFAARPPASKPLIEEAAHEETSTKQQSGFVTPARKKQLPKGKKKMFFLSQSVGSDSEPESPTSGQSVGRFPKLSPSRSKQEEEMNKPLRSTSLKNEALLDEPPSAQQTEQDDADADDSSGWGSDYSDASEHNGPSQTVNKKGKVQQSEDTMFTKRVPTAPGPLNRTESRTGLLTQLFRPSADEEKAVAGLLRNPSAVGLVLAGKAKSSADALPARSGLQPSKSAVALPLMSYDDKEGAFPQRTQQPVQTKPAQPIPTKSRLGGRPHDVEYSDSSSSDGEVRSAEAMALSPEKAAALAAAVARTQARYIMGPQTPRTTRRAMLSTELSESLRRNLLWERQSRNRLLGNGPTVGNRQPQPAPPVADASRTAPQVDERDSLSRLHRRNAASTTALSGGLHEHGW